MALLVSINATPYGWLLNPLIVSSDFEQFLPIHITNQGVISISAVDDFITLEYDDRVRLTFTPSNPALVPGLEDFGEYIRDTSIVNINDTDSKHIMIGDRERANLVVQTAQFFYYNYTTASFFFTCAIPVHASG